MLIHYLFGPQGETPESLTPNTKDETPKTKDEENLTKTTETTREPRPQVRTRSRTRKAPSEAENEPSDTEAHTTKPKVALLHRHQEMETHISLLDQHSREQRVNLERLLQEERAMKDRNLGRIQELERALQGKEELISRQETGLVSLSRELEQLAVSARQLQNELDQERETASRLRKVPPGRCLFPFVSRRLGSRTGANGKLRRGRGEGGIRSRKLGEGREGREPRPSSVNVDCVSEYAPE